MDNRDRSRALKDEAHLDHTSHMSNVSNSNHLSTYRKKTKAWKPYVISIFSALTISLAIGFILLNLFSSPEELTIDGGIDPTLVTNENNDEDERESTLLNLEIDQMSAYVLQVGVFSTIENANEWRQFYETEGYPLFSWKRDDQYYLFAGMYPTENIAKEQAEDMESQSLEVYVKEWTTPRFAIDVHPSGADWFETFLSQFRTTLQTIHEPIELDVWKKLYDDALDDDLITSIQNHLRELIEQMENDEQSNHLFLFELWSDLEQMAQES